MCLPLLWLSCFHQCHITLIIKHCILEKSWATLSYTYCHFSMGSKPEFVYSNLQLYFVLAEVWPILHKVYSTEQQRGPRLYRSGVTDYCSRKVESDPGVEANTTTSLSRWEGCRPYSEPILIKKPTADHHSLNIQVTLQYTQIITHRSRKAHSHGRKPILVMAN